MVVVAVRVVVVVVAAVLPASECVMCIVSSLTGDWRGVASVCVC